MLESVTEFSVKTGLPHDVMHELFEGVVRYELRALLVHCINEDYFSADEFIERLQCFDYGYSETDKPSTIDGHMLLHKDTGGIRQTVSKCGCFLKSIIQYSERFIHIYV